MNIHTRSLTIVVTLVAALMAIASSAVAQTVIWDNGSGDMTWTQPDSTNWSGSNYESGDLCVFTNTGAGVVTISGTVTPGGVTINSTSNYTFIGGAIGGTGNFNINETGSGSNIVVTFANTNTFIFPARCNVGGYSVLDVGNVANNALSNRCGLLLGSKSSASGIYGILQGNGTFTRNLFNSSTPGPNDVSGAAGGFAARGGTLTVNLGGAGATVALNQSAFEFGNNLVFGSRMADSQVIWVNPINLNGVTTNTLRVVTVIAGVGGDSAEIQGPISDDPSPPTPNGLLKEGNGLLILSATNTYTAATSIGDGTLQLTGLLAPASWLNLGDTNNNSGIFILGGSGGPVDQTVAGLTSTGSGTSNAVVGGNASVSTLTVNLATDNSTNNPDNFYVCGASLGGPGPNENNLALVISGAGTQVLSGTNTYTGPTTVNAAELLVDGSLATGSAVTVSSSGTLGGSGTVNGSVQVNVGGAIAPGSGSNSTLTVANNLTLDTGANALFWLNTTNSPGTNSYLAVSGTQSITGSTLTVTNLGPALQAGDSFTLLSQPTAGFTTVNLPAGYTWANNLATDGSIQVMTVVPTNIITYSVSGSVGNQQLVLDWPSGLGWQLQAQTNSLGTNWFNVTGTPPYTNIINPATPAVFFRLEHL